MKTKTVSKDLLNMLNQALARELQVSVQYMLQHAIGAGRKLDQNPKGEPENLLKFVASNALYFMPGKNLKKIAITEMRHAEAISERIVILGGDPTTKHEKITMSESMQGMLVDDQKQEEGAIELYNRIIALAKKEGDDLTARLFRSILKDEEKHHETFTDLIG
jgi:bacterioferritin